MFRSGQYITILVHRTLRCLTLYAVTKSSPAKMRDAGSLHGSADLALSQGWLKHVRWKICPRWNLYSMSNPHRSVQVAALSDTRV